MCEVYQAVHTENHRHTRNRIKVILGDVDVTAVLVDKEGSVTVLDHLRWWLKDGSYRGFTMVDDRIDFDDPDTDPALRAAHEQAK
jgi:hypothetical protein